MDDRAQIRQLIEDWVIWRDTGQWDRFAGLWHEDGRMVATWSQSGVAEFIERSRAGWKAGLKVFHTLGGSSIDVVGARALAQSKMQIVQRAPVHGQMVDVICQGLFVDAFERRDGRWGLVLRQPVYELDRMIPLDPAATLVLDKELLESFPESYRHLAYLQTQMGMSVSRSLPGPRSSEVEALYESGRRWLSGDGRDPVLAVH